MQPGQGGARFDAELGAEHVAQLVVGAQGLGLPPGAVEGQHPLRPQAFPDPVGRGERLQLADQLAVAAADQVGVDPLLERDHAGLVQAGGLRPRARRLGDVGQRGAPPQRECRPQGGRSLLVLAR